MKDRDGEAQPDDNYQTRSGRTRLEPESDELASVRSCPDCGEERVVGIRYCANCGADFHHMFEAARPLEMPHKADLSRADQARRVAPSSRPAAPAAPVSRVGSRHSPLPVAPLRPSAGSITDSVDEDRDASEPAWLEQAHRVAGPTGAPVRLTSPHPLSRRRREERGRRAGGPLTSLDWDLARANIARLGNTFVAALRGRPSLGLPKLRSLFGFAGLTATFGVVTALIVTLPSTPGIPLASGSIYGVTWHAATPAPIAKVDFGPYFITIDDDLLMLATTDSTTTVWATSDGSTWSQRSGSGAFGIDGRRFVPQGLSDDGQGGLVVVGNSLGQSATDVSASAWRSRDGASWTPMDVQSGNGQEMIGGVAARAGAIVAAGNGVAWLSTDGRSWSPQPLPGAAADGGTYSPRAVGTWEGGFVIIGQWTGGGSSRSTAWYSSTGRNWTQAKTSLEGFAVRALAGLNGRIVAVGTDLGEAAQSLATSWSSDDGSTWTNATPPTDLTTVAMDGVIRIDGSLVAFGAPPLTAATAAQAAGPTLPGSTPAAPAAELVWVSENGVEWLPVTGTTAPLNRARMASVGGRVIMIGGSNDGMSVISGDLVMGPARAAATATLPPAQYALSVQAGNAPMITDVTKSFTLGPVTSSKDRFYIFATGPSGTSIFSSPDGGLWAREASPSGLTASGVTGRPVVLQAIPDGKGGIIAVGKVTNPSGDNGMIWHMTTPGKWTQVALRDDPPPEFASIAAGEGQFVAASDMSGGSKVMYSADGDTWQAGSITVNEDLALTVATYQHGYVALGRDPLDRTIPGLAWTSPDGQTWTMRTDWHLPLNVTALFGTGNGVVAAADTAEPTSSASPSASASASPSPSPSAKPGATPAAATKTTTWWWSATGVAWLQSGLVTTSASWAFVNGQVLVIDAPAKAGSNWVSWVSSDGKSWQQPRSSAIRFAGSKTCAVGSIGSRVIIVSWDAPGALRDFYGKFAPR
jgi:hypothetical protein